MGAKEVNPDCVFQKDQKKKTDVVTELRSTDGQKDRAGFDCRSPEGGLTDRLPINRDWEKDQAAKRVPYLTRKGMRGN